MTEILENLPTYAGIVLGTYSALLFGAQVLQDLASEKNHFSRAIRYHC